MYCLCVFLEFLAIFGNLRNIRTFFVTSRYMKELEELKLERVIFGKIEKSEKLVMLSLSFGSTSNKNNF